ncbi:MAG: hypothetical protein OSB43_01390, partial [Nocardioides sp.]|uniref:hypothetical protein n=1 Tax=Nocardioides sp. TaxID=35761 RepID=UPI0023895C8E
MTARPSHVRRPPQHKTTPVAYLQGFLHLVEARQARRPSRRTHRPVLDPTRLVRDGRVRRDRRAAPQRP